MKRPTTTRAIRSEYIDGLIVSDGTNMSAWTSRPIGEVTNMGVVVLQEAFGVTAHIRSVTECFAREGYIAIAPELFHRTAPPRFEGRYDDLANVLSHVHAIENESLGADLRSAYDWICASTTREARIGAVGFCMGGRAAFLAALTLPLTCGVSFYGTGIAPTVTRPGLIGRAAELKCPLLLYWGGRDEHINQRQVEAVASGLRSAGSDFVSVEISEASHGFLCDGRESYSPTATALAWSLTLAFLKAHFEKPRG